VKSLRHIGVAIFDILCRYDAYVDLRQARAIGFLSPFNGSQIGNLLAKRGQVWKCRPRSLKLRDSTLGSIEYRFSACHQRLLHRTLDDRNWGESGCSVFPSKIGFRLSR
jgi:hypothetical protein